MKLNYILPTTALIAGCLSGWGQKSPERDRDWKLYPTENTSAIYDSIATKPPVDQLLDDTIAYDVEEPAFVEITQDYRIKQLLEKDKYLNSKMDPPQIDGYRIKIYFGSGANSQKEANQAKAKFLKVFPDEQVYVNWATPNYTATVGNFRSKMDAEKFLKKKSRLIFLKDLSCQVKLSFQNWIKPQYANHKKTSR